MDKIDFRFQPLAVLKAEQLNAVLDVINGNAESTEINIHAINQSIENLASDVSGDSSAITALQESLDAEVTRSEAKDADLQGQINYLVNSGAVITLTSTLDGTDTAVSAVFTNTPTAIKFTAVTDTEAAPDGTTPSVVIKQGTREVGASFNNTKRFQAVDNIVEESSTSLIYTAVFNIATLPKSTTKTIYIVDKIFYGVGTDSSYAGITNYQSARTSAAGSYYYEIVEGKQYTYILQPAAMTAINLSNVKLSGFTYNMQQLSDTTINGVAYRVYRSVAPNAVGQKFTVVVS